MSKLKGKVSPTWKVLRSLRHYDKYLTGRSDIVRLANDPFVHKGNLAYVMLSNSRSNPRVNKNAAARVWLHTLCGVAYAVYPDPRTSALRHDVVILERHPPGAMSCTRCEEWEKANYDDDE